MAKNPLSFGRDYSPPFSPFIAIGEYSDWNHRADIDSPLPLLLID